MKVIIIGAEVDGLICAIACKREQLNVIVLEQHAEIEVNAGIQIPPNGARVLHHLDLLEAVTRKGTSTEYLDLRRFHDGALIRSMPWGEPVRRAYGGPWLNITRADLLDILLDKARQLEIDIRPHAIVEEIHCGTAEVVLKDGARIQGDVVIGADGLTRDTVLNHPSPPSPASDIAYQATISRSALKAIDDGQLDELCTKNKITTWLGSAQHTVIFPVRQGEEYMLVTYHAYSTPPAEAAGLTQIQALHQGWDHRLPTILAHATFASQTTHHTLRDLPTWRNSRTLLLGTASRIIPPYQAQDLAATLEDAAVLSTLLGLLNHHSPAPDQLPRLLPEILALHEALRRPAATKAVQAGLLSRRVLQVGNPVGQVLRNWFLGGAGITRDTDAGWLKLVSAQQEATLGGGGGGGGGRGSLLDETRARLEAWRKERLPLLAAEESRERSSGGYGIGRKRLRCWTY
ncbi:FAD/NAD(P)-binding domain-containing protein [Aspergillus brunneoviolaceus CBS 621.78]|uniref:FAD/NAD(P)-binding domain-containing protein n=1 Tax=Aspergillus brunneoviolaceus CBS 621.78 TaxID=1450534 RepID=A0ACD1G259_9EURO|nr:FAD/NAD(P)-binding domain-containing protein [Aspergillus brunneoviolaceus CBS 621.78]RAH43362.1 FAD/NAD(P)-binding domain-containing protein [Aspergillus brunneoviolaceus CBS 621.78]